MKPSRVALPCALVLLLTACAGAGSSTTTGSDPSGPGSSSSTDESASAPVDPSTAAGSETRLDPPTSGEPTVPGGSGVQTSSDADDLTLLPTTGGGATLTLTGIPAAGVEDRCWLLDGYLLVGAPTGLLGTGRQITVIGRAEPDLMTTCQQGIPLRVESAVPA